MREVKAVQITQFRRDAVVKVFLGSQKRVREIPKRGEINSFSDRSRSRLLFTAFNSSVDWLAFSVLTYPSEFPYDGRKVKRHINLMCVWLCRKFDAKVLWGIEFQERGAPHVNLLIDKFIPKGELGHKWYEIVGSGDWRHLAAGTRIEFCESSDQAAGYMAAAYSAKKSVQKTVPPGFEHVGRFWGASRGLVVKVDEQVYLLSEGQAKIRALRKFTEKSVKPRKVQPMREEKKRRRKVKRKPTYFLHSGLQGFRVFKGASIASRLLQIHTSV